MYKRTIIIGVLFAIASFSVTKTARAVLFGDSAAGPDWEAIVSLNGGSCTATFIHPRFAITAAHCIRQCTSPTDIGCVTGTAKQVVEGNWTGRDGPSVNFANAGVQAGTGPLYNFNFVYFPTPSEMSRSIAPDVALLRSATAFSGKVIPMLPTQDLPRPSEGIYCPRYEYTWPTIVGFSPNSGIATSSRRFGRSFAECDLELDETLFKLDAHGRNVRGARICQGDSGGPVLWETGFGGFAVGGINSIGDTRNPNDPIMSNQVCMNWGNLDDQLRGESGHAFVPANFLNRVALTDAACGGATGWDTCVSGVVAYNGHRLLFIGTEIDQCGNDDLWIAGNAGLINVPRGGAGATEIPGWEFTWYCGDSEESTTAPAGTRFLIARRGITDRQIIWNAYLIAPDPVIPYSELMTWLPSILMSVMGE